jgi:hypothetical protein
MQVIQGWRKMQNGELHNRYELLEKYHYSDKIKENKVGEI